MVQLSFDLVQVLFLRGISLNSPVSVYLSIWETFFTYFFQLFIEKLMLSWMCMNCEETNIWKFCYIWSSCWTECWKKQNIFGSSISNANRRKNWKLQKLDILCESPLVFFIFNCRFLCTNTIEATHSILHHHCMIHLLRGRDSWKLDLIFVKSS